MDVNSSKNGRFRYEIIDETQPEMELLEVVTLFYPFSLKAGGSIPLPPEFNSSTQHRCILWAVLSLC